MASLVIQKNEFKVLLNNGVTTQGTVRTNTVKVADLALTAVDATTAASLINIADAIEMILSKSIYETVVVQTTQLRS